MRLGQPFVVAMEERGEDRNGRAGGQSSTFPGSLSGSLAQNEGTGGPQPQGFQYAGPELWHLRRIFLGFDFRADRAGLVRVSGEEGQRAVSRHAGRVELA